MAYNNNQFEYPPPIDGDQRRHSAYHLPKYFRTEFNKKFLASTLDQLMQPGTAEKLSGYYGRKHAKGYQQNDSYIGDVSADRENYQLEPAAVIKDDLGNVDFYADYNDYINQIRNFDGGINDHSILNAQEYYAWNPHIDWDKIVNFREYYWLPSGPQTVPVIGETVEVESTYTVEVVDNNDNYGYVFTPDGLTQNPQLTLYRGIKYKFEINAPGNPIYFRTRKVEAPKWRAGKYYDVGELALYNGSVYTAVGTHLSQPTFEADGDKWELDTQFNLATQVSQQGVENGTVEIELDFSTPDTIYYSSGTDIYASGSIRVKDVTEATFIDIEKDILGKKTYTTGSGFALSNGMKVEFPGETSPSKYSEGAWYVEGVGTGIRLISEEEINVPSSFTQDLTVAFDTEGFDRLPYSEALGYPVNKDYITINRASRDGNLWSKYNRWFHRSVIEESERINGSKSELDQTARATRPIIEFESDLKLYNFGTSIKANVDLIDDFTTDAFSIVEGATGYNIDGIDVTNGMRIIFTNDSDPLVKGRIFEVQFITFNNIRQITLVETSDSIPTENETLLCKQGNVYKGKMLWFNGDNWITAQDKTTVNQSPLFDVFDCEGNSYSDATVYESTTFTGTKVFSYEIGSGANDNELGFPLKYRSIENIGDIVFNFNLLTDSMTYCPFASNPIDEITGSGYLRKYSSIDDYQVVNGWSKAHELSTQPVIRQYVVDNSLLSYPIDVYDNSGLLDDLWVRVYVNNVLMFENDSYTITTDIQNRAVINFTNRLAVGDVILIKTKSSAHKNNNGLYEIPSNLERNPQNEDISTFTLGEINDHVGTIIEESSTFNGAFPGVSNLRDLGAVSKYGKRVVKHSGPLNLALYHLVDRDANLVKALKYSRKEYGKFKRQFLQTSEKLGFSGSVKVHVDAIFKELNKDKIKTMPFYFSDMVPYGAATHNIFEIEDPNLQYFALSEIFDITTPSDKAVEIYQNEIQLIYGKDYTFNDQGFAIITTEKTIGDIIDIYEYETTNGSFVPATPTKLGLYPKYEPSKFIDDTYLESQEVIQGHDGSIIIAFGDYRDDLLLELEKRIYNNLKVEYDPELFNIHNFMPGENRNTKLTRKQLEDSMISDFVEWTQLTDDDYTQNPTYLREDTFTFNHVGMASFSGAQLSGYWRAVYKYAYDTDRPHTHPWEMLGFTIKPTWWDEQYGEAPYTSNNFLMWEDIEAGIIREPGLLPTVNPLYVRENLLDHLPVDEDGNLVSPVLSGYVTEYSTTRLNEDFVYGDYSPVESAWRRGSEYPFALLTSIFLNQPARALATGFDRTRQLRGIVGDVIYGSPNRQVRLSDLKFPNSVDAKIRTYTSGFVNYIYDYLASNVNTTYEDYIENIRSITNQIGFKLAGFTSKDKFKLILDSRTPLNEGNVFVPEENYKIFLNKSVPVQNVYYSGVIIEKKTYGFVVKGYNNDQPYFKYNRPFPLASDPYINVGGVSENFVYWDVNKTYYKGTIVEFENAYYRVTEAHTSSDNFEGTKFVKLPALPLVGGTNAYFRKKFSTKETIVSYGTVLRTTQDVVDFLLGYGNYLEQQGFVFDYYSPTDEFVADWQTSSKEFMFWTTQNWKAESVITLSPVAYQLKFKSDYAMVDDVYDTFYGYRLLKADGKKLSPTYVSLTREEPREFILRTKATEDGIFAARLSLVQKEHVVLLDNTTVFGDIIYDQEPGYRQERIRVLGYRTTDWDGSLNIPGFVFDNAKVTEWKQWTDYAIGDLVKYKEFYYTARNKISGSDTFDATKWSRLNEEPKMGLIPNFEYKVNQFADFYDLDTDNFDVEQQKFAQHLIGYQNRDYLANIINDDVSQYKFYQGMIQDKGTRNALDKLFDVLSSADKDSLDFYEEWAVKQGQYGAADGFEEVEYIIDESKMRLSPQSFELVNSITGNETDLVYRLLPYEAYLAPADYNHAPFPAKTIKTSDTYVKNSGYVNGEDVNFIVANYDAISEIDYETCNIGDLIWVGNDGNEWGVYNHINTDIVIESAVQGTNVIELTASMTVNNIDPDDIIGVYDITDLSNGFYKVTSVSNNIIEIAYTLPGFRDLESLDGRITRLLNVRVNNIKDANTLLQNEFASGHLNRIWIDDTGSNNWKVLEKTNTFNEHQVLTNPDLGTEHNYGAVISTNDKNTVLAIGSPDNGDGKVFIYTRAGNSGSYQLVQEIAAEDGLSDESIAQRFGASVAVSPDGKFLAIGSPNASNVKTLYSGEWEETTDYPQGSIVSYNDSLWEAFVDVEGQENNIRFNSFHSTAQSLVALGLGESDDEQLKGILTGNYPFKGVYTDHILMKAPKDMYEGTKGYDDLSDPGLLNDIILTDWNVNSYANQAYTSTTDVEPFGGNIPELDSSFFTGTLDIKQKIDAILYVEEANTIPLLGQIVEVPGGFGTVAYTFNPSDGSTTTANTTIYVKDVNGTFGTQGSLTTSIGEYVGEYVTYGPTETQTGVTDIYGGYWLIPTPTYFVDNVNYDESRGLVIKDVITNDSGDSTDRSYYNVLDYDTTVTSSYNTRNTQLTVLTYEGIPGLIADTYESRFYVLRVPEQFSNKLDLGFDAPGSSNNPKFNLFYNPLPLYEDAEWQPETEYTEGQILKYVTGIFPSIYWRVKQDHTSEDDFYYPDLTTADPNDYTYNTSYYEALDELPWNDPSELALDISKLNTEHTVYDLWDGYIDIQLTKTYAPTGEYIEPIIGLTVQDVTNFGTAEVTFYQRFDTQNIRIYVKDVSGTWAQGNLFGENREIQFLADGSGDPLYDPAAGYRVFGQIQSRSLGLPGDGTTFPVGNGIGKLVVLDYGSNIPLERPTDAALTDEYYTFLDSEYWVYDTATVLGIERLPSYPAEDNNDWTQVYNIPASSGGTPGGLTNEGLYHIYERRGVGQFIKINSYIVPERLSGNYLGADLKFAKLGDFYRLFVKADNNNGKPGRVYVIKNGIENGYEYFWDLAKDKEYKGEFNASRTYFENDIVYYDNILYQALTNIEPPQGVPSDAVDTDWAIVQGPTAYVNYMPNDLGILVHDSSRADNWDSSNILDQDYLIEFATDFDISADGEVVIATALYSQDKTTKIAVYRNYQGYYEYSQGIESPNDDVNFGRSISISADGKIIAVGSSGDDAGEVDHGAVYVYAQNTDGVFEFTQKLEHADKERAEQFGYKVQFDGNRLAISSKNGDASIETTYDVHSRPLEGYVLDSDSALNDTPTTFDRGFTNFKDFNRDAGTINVYQRLNDSLIFGHILDFDFTDVDDTDNIVRYFGRNMILSNNHIYVGLPRLSYNPSREGTIVDYRLQDKTTIWTTLRETKDTVDVSKIKRVMLYDTKTKELLTYLDYIDILQGKVAGTAEQELSYKTYYDPAVYSAGIGVSVDPTNSWNETHVGKLWWDLTNAKFLDPNQGNVIYGANNWNEIFSNQNSIDVYEWVKSEILPSEWDDLSGTEAGDAQGITGLTKYGDDAYVTKRVYDSASKTFGTYYYFWVKSKTSIPNVENRSISGAQVEKLILDPATEGYKFVSFISPTEFALHNCEDLIRGKDIALSIQYWTIENQEINVHNQYQILTEGLASSKPNIDIERKWFDSLVGYDEQNREVPAPELSAKEKYGSLNRPRQSWFVNRAEALKQVIDRVNGVLINTLLADDKDISPLTQNEEPPLESSNRYDRTVDALIDLQFVGVAKARQAQLTPIVENGKIVRVEIEDSGRGYLTPPTVSILGTGENAVITTEIDNVGSVIAVNVENSGEYYSLNTRLTVRRYTVLVNSDETLNGKWALYERDTTAKEWIRVESQSYDTNLYWEYADWYDTGYSSFTEIDHLIDYAYDLDSVNDSIGDIVKIKTVGTGGWLLLEKVDNQANTDYSVNYKTVGRQDGTIQFKSTLYDTTESLVGFDVTTYDALLFDSVPSVETRIILETLRDNIFVDELEIEYNNLFFASLRYVFAEQSYVDWAFKTSFIKAQHNVGDLKQYVNFQNDNLPSYEDYINEVKPYKSKIREYLSSYEKIENSQSMVSDFDLPPRYVSTYNKILPQTVKVKDNEIVNLGSDIATYPSKHWNDNVGYKVLEINISNPGAKYAGIPVIEISGGGGSGAKARASLGPNGTISNIVVTATGSGYLSAPTVYINGSVLTGGEEATAVATIGQTPVRTMHTVVKFDRVSGVYEFVNLATTETFTTTGNREEFNLEWPMDLRTTRVAVYLDNDQVLGGQYTYENVLDTSKGYDRYKGKIIFDNPPVSGQELRIEYYKDIKMLKAQDRINLAYNPTTEQFGKTLGQLMDGVDYGGVEVRSFEFGGTTGWDSNPWFTQGWDIYDTTFEDEIFRLDESTISIELSKPLELDVEYNIYRVSYDVNGVLVRNERMDDSDWDGSTIGTEDNPSARMLPLTGDGTTTTIFLDEYNIPTTTIDATENSVIVIVRKSTSDGSFLPDPDSYDTLVQGGDLAYSTATGLNAADINIDGDGFVTPTTSKGPEEVVPGQVLDTVDITVYERANGGTSNIHSRNYTGDGSTRTYEIGTIPVKAENLFVKTNGTAATITTEYNIDYDNGTVTFVTAPASGIEISLITLENSAASILDLVTFEGDGATVEFLTNARWEDDADVFVTADGEVIPASLIKSDDTYEYPNNFVIKTATPVKNGARISAVITQGEEQNVQYSQVSIDTIIADGSTTVYNLADSSAIFAQEPIHFYTIVKVNNTILTPGYSQEFTITGSEREYQFDLAQVPVASLNYYDLEVYLNGRKLEYLQEWTFEGAGAFDSSLLPAAQPGSTVILEPGIANNGDELKVFVVTGGEYRFGYLDSANEFISTPSTLYLDSTYNEDDVITVYQFSNHDSQGIERYALEVTEKTELTISSEAYYAFALLERGLVPLRNQLRDDQYVWISLNGELLTPSVDYSLTENRRYVQLVSQPNQGDVIDVLHFSNELLSDKFGWRQFKDMLNRTHYKRLDDVYTLAEDLNWYDKTIEVVDATGLPEPDYDTKSPGIIFLDGERIEFFNRTGNTLNQLRRGTLGTGVKEVYEAGSQFVEQGADTNMPYKDETEVLTITADGTSTTFELPFDESILNKRYGQAKDLIEVFVGGTRLRKDPIEVYNNELAQDSTEGDETHPAEFSISGNILTLVEPPEEHLKISIIRKIGKRWNELGTTLSQADSDISRFLRAKTTDLPR